MRFAAGEAPASPGDGVAAAVAGCWVEELPDDGALVGALAEGPGFAVWASVANVVPLPSGCVLG